MTAKLEGVTAPGKPTLFDSLARFVPEDLRAEYYRVLAHTRRTTLAKYRTFVNQLNTFAANRGYIRIDQLSVLDMDRFYASWTDGIRSRAKKLERLKSFVQFCKKRNWLTEDSAEDLDAPHGASVVMPKAPFSDEELKRIYAACDRIGAPTRPGPGYRTWSGEDAKDFIFLSVYTGLRISDVATHLNPMAFAIARNTPQSGLPTQSIRVHRPHFSSRQWARLQMDRMRSSSRAS